MTFNPVNKNYWKEERLMPLMAIRYMDLVNGAKDVYIKFSHEIMSNAQENAQNELTEAQRRQIEINILLDLLAQFDNETLMKLICEQLDIKYEDIKDKLPDNEEKAAKQAGKCSWIPNYQRVIIRG